VKTWRNTLVLIIGFLLVLISFVVYGTHVLKTTPILQNGWFLFTFLPGLTMLGIYGTIGIRGQEFQQRFLVKVFIVLMLVTNTITVLIFLVTAQSARQDSLPAFWLSLVVPVLALANFVFLLFIWNGRHWGVWAFGSASFLLCTLKFVGRLPVFPVIFEFSSVFVLIYLLRSSWAEMH
jgi:hypothetical protein